MNNTSIIHLDGFLQANNPFGNLSVNFTGTLTFRYISIGETNVTASDIQYTTQCFSLS